MKNIKAIIIGIVFLLLVGTMTSIKAQDEEIILNVEGFNFISWFRHTFGLQDYSIIGQNRKCDEYVRTGNTLYFDKGDRIYIEASDYCSPGYGLIDIFDGIWNPLIEFKDSVPGLNCYDDDGCIAEVYCCPNDECTSDSQCESWEGSGSECIVIDPANNVDPLIDYWDNQYSYCTDISECTGPDITCWREESGVCVSRTYECWYGTYPNCPTTYHYTSKSECEADIEEEPPVITCGVEGDKCFGGPELCCEGLKCQFTLKELGWRCLPEDKEKEGEIDSDGDGYSDILEKEEGTDPLDKEDFPEEKEKDVSVVSVDVEALPPPECITEQGIFYTDGYAIIGRGNFKFLGYASEKTSGDLAVINTKDLQSIIPGLSAKYFENRATACCGDMKALYDDEKTFQYSRADFSILKVFGIGALTDVVLGWFGIEKEADIEKITVTYSVYKCVPKEEVGLCLEFAHRLLNPLTKSGDCQQNTIILIVVIIFGFIVISRFAGVYGDIKYEM